jgi:hypothetical protein
VQGKGILVVIPLVPDMAEQPPILDHGPRAIAAGEAAKEWFNVVV